MPDGSSPLVTGTDGQGQPAGSILVPAGQPCPSGFVPYSPPVEVQVGWAFEELPATWQTEAPTAGACQPSYSISASGQWITPDDCLQVTVYTLSPTTGLVLNGRILDCNGVLHYMQEDLDGVAPGVITTITVPLTPGFLLNVGVTDPGGEQSPGDTFVSIGLQHTCQAGQGATGILGQGYVTGVYGVSWPGVSGGAPYAAPGFRPPAGTVTLLQHKAALVNSNYTVSVALAQTVTAGSCLVAFTMPNALVAPVTLGDDQGNTWTKNSSVNGIYDIWIATNCKGGFTTVTQSNNQSNLGSMQLHVFEIAGLNATTPVDVFASGVQNTPLTLTTSSTSYVDVGIAQVCSTYATGATLNVPSGWVKVEDTAASDERRMISLWNPNKSQPTAPWSFTADMGNVWTYDQLVTLQVASS